MDPPGLPYNTLGAREVPNNTGSTSGMMTHSNSALPAAMTAAPNVFPQVYPVVNQNVQPVYLTTNFYRPAQNPHILPQATVYNQTVRGSADSSMQTRYMYVSVSNNAVPGPVHPVRPQNNMTFVSGSQIIPPHQYQSNPQVIGGYRPLVPTTMIGETVQTSGTSTSISRAISVHWVNPGSNIGPPRPLNVTQGRNPSNDVRQRHTGPPEVGTSTSTHVQATDRESFPSLPEIPTQRICPTNDPRRSDCNVRIPPRAMEDLQRDPRSSTLVRRILDRFGGSHGSVPPFDPRSQPTTTTAARDSPLRQASTAPVASCSGESSTGQGLHQRPLESNPLPGAESRDPKPDAHPPAGSPAKGKARTKVVPRLSDRQRLLNGQGKSLDRWSDEREPPAQTDPRTRVPENPSPNSDGDSASEQPPGDDDETESSDSPLPEDPRQKRLSQANESRAVGVASPNASPSQDFAADPRCSDGKHKKSVYTYVSRPSASIDRNHVGTLPTEVSEIQPSGAGKRSERNTVKTTEPIESAEKKRASSGGRRIDEAEDRNFLNSVDSRVLGSEQKTREEVEKTNQTRSTPVKRRTKLFVDSVYSDDSQLSPPKKAFSPKGVTKEQNQTRSTPVKRSVKLSIDSVYSDVSRLSPAKKAFSPKGVTKVQIQIDDADCGIPEEELPPQSSEFATCGNLRSDAAEESQVKKSAKPKRRRRGADTLTLSESNILPSSSRKRQRVVRFASKRYEGDPSRSGDLDNQSDSESEENNDIGEPIQRAVKRRKRTILSSESDEDPEKDREVAQKVDSSVPESAGRRSEISGEIPGRISFKDGIGERGIADQMGGNRGAEESPVGTSTRSTEPPAAPETSADGSAESSRSDLANVSSPSTIMDARLQSDEEEELREEHERENARLVIEKLCELQRAFEQQPPLKLRKQQMTALMGTLDDMLKISRRNAGPTKIVVPEEPKKIPDRLTPHKESVTNTRQEEGDGEGTEDGNIREDEKTKGDERASEDENARGDEEAKRTEPNRQAGVENSSSSPEIVTERKNVKKRTKKATEAPEQPRALSIAELLEPYKDEGFWSPYLDDETSKVPVPVIVLQDIHLGPSTTRRLKMKASEIRKREQICELCPFVSLNTLSLEKHVESYHAQKS